MRSKNRRESLSTREKLSKIHNSTTSSRHDSVLGVATRDYAARQRGHWRSFFSSRRDKETVVVEVSKISELYSRQPLLSGVTCIHRGLDARQRRLYGQSAKKINSTTFSYQTVSSRSVQVFQSTGKKFTDTSASIGTCYDGRVNDLLKESQVWVPWRIVPGLKS